MGCLKKKKTPSELSDGRSTYLFFTLLGDGHPSYSFPQVPIYMYVNMATGPWVCQKVAFKIKIKKHDDHNKIYIYALL